MECLAVNLSAESVDADQRVVDVPEHQSSHARMLGDAWAEGRVHVTAASLHTDLAAARTSLRRMIRNGNPGGAAARPS
ncbi:hypothetical protein GCM10009780_29870 [Actinomadura alba]